MAKNIIIDENYGNTRIAIIKEDQILKFFSENMGQNPIKGNIYLGKIVNIEPSLQVAFVNYGENKNGFLELSHIHPNYFNIPIEDREKIRKLEGNNLKNELKKYKIQEVINSGKLVLIQIIKEERGKKCAAVSTYLSFTGKYSILNVYKEGIKITNKSNIPEEKAQKIIDKLQEEKENGVILKQSALTKSVREIKKDIKYLKKLWENTKEIVKKSVAPSLVYTSTDIVLQAIRDYFDKETEKVIVSGKENYKKCKRYVRLFAPKHIKKVLEYEEKQPIFNFHKIEDLTEKVHETSAPLPSGGHIVIEQTEAFVSIDINSGRSSKSRNIHETILQTNLEAVKVICNQIITKNLSGIIVIDFIDMQFEKHKKKVEKQMREMCKNDDVQGKILNINTLGLMIMSRQRSGISFTDTYYEKCNKCSGEGIITSLNNQSLKILREIENKIYQKETPIIETSPTVAEHLINNYKNFIIKIEEENDLKINFKITEE